MVAKRKLSEIPAHEIAEMDAALNHMYAGLDPERRAFKIAGKRPFQLLYLCVHSPREGWEEPIAEQRRRATTES